MKNNKYFVAPRCRCSGLPCSYKSFLLIPDLLLFDLWNITEFRISFRDLVLSQCNWIQLPSQHKWNSYTSIFTSQVYVCIYMQTYFVKDTDIRNCNHYGIYISAVLFLLILAMAFYSSPQSRHVIYAVNIWLIWWFIQRTFVLDLIISIDSQKVCKVGS